MALTFVNDSATIGSAEYSLPADSTSLAAQTDDVYLHGWLDASAMAAGDVFLVQLYEKVNAGTARVVWYTYLNGTQAKLTAIPRFLVGDGWDLTVKKIAGTDRAIAWSLRKDDGAATLGANSITSTVIQDGAITAAKFAAGAITSTVIATDAIDGDSIKADAVTKIQNGLATDGAVSSLQTEVSGISADVADVDTAVAAANTAIAALPTATAIRNAIMAYAIESGETFEATIKNLAAVWLGAATVPEGDGSFAFKARDGSTTRVAGALTSEARTISTRTGT